ncbi:MAG: polysaccharide biosynthesis/export family protein, partial [Rhodoferax sp.]
MKQQLYRNPHLLVAAFLAFSGLTSHAQAPAPAPVTAAVASAPTPTQVKPDYPLGVGDAIRIQVFQNPDLTIETRVSENGSITYPMIGAVEIGGLSIAAAE